MTASALTEMELAYHYPASIGQQDIWLQDRFRANGVQNVSRAWRIDGAIDLSALQQALDSIVRRHSTLRSHFVSGANGAEVAVRPNARVLVDLAELETHHTDLFPGEHQIQLLLNGQFDLERGPLWRCVFVRAGATQGILVVSLHHAIADGWSLGVFCRELTDGYLAALNRTEPGPADLDVDFADFAAHERSRLEGGEFEASSSFWRSHLADRPAAPSFFRPKPEMREPRHAMSRSFKLSADVITSIDALAAAARATRFAVLLAAYRLSLASEFGYRDVVVGTPVARRDSDELEPMIGFLANALPLRTPIVPGRTVLDFVRECHLAVVEGLDHGHYPTLKIVETAAPDRTDAGHPLFKAWFAYHSYVSVAPAFDGARVTPVNAQKRWAIHEVAIDLTPSGREVEGVATAPESALTAEGLVAFVGRFETVLRDLAANPAAEVTDILAAKASDWADEAGLSGVLASIAARVRAHPRKIAVYSERSTLRYQDVWRRARDVAANLSRRGLGCGDCICLDVDRSADLPVLVLAIWMCGATYVPLDPAQPEARRGLILERSKARLLITDKEPTAAACTAIHVDDLSGQGDRDHPPTGAQGSAYVMFTSGSTGVPKGVEVSHSALDHFSSSFAGALDLSSADLVFAATTVCFDISLLELVVPLTVGATVFVAAAMTSQRPDRLKTALDRVAPTLFQATPTSWRLLLAAGWRGGSHLRAVCGGEALTWDLADRIKAISARAYNVYGPTEATIWCSILDLADPAARHRSQPYVPIGRPVSGVDFVSAAVDGGDSDIGELFISGALLALGYLNDPPRTRERFGAFVQPGGRQYRTGDLVRREGDVYSFVGRADDQVKVRGYRIELGEIDAALLRHPALSAAATIVLPGEDGEPRLTSYYIADPAPSVAELREHLKSLLPPYFIPDAFVARDALPVSPNGKLDRSRLAALLYAPAASSDLAGPTMQNTSAEVIQPTLSAIWCEILGCESPAIDADFFTLGGHSVQVAQLHHRLQQAFGVELSLSEIYDEPTFHAMGRLIASRAQARLPSPSGTPPAVAVRPTAYPVSQSQLDDLALSDADPADPHAHIGFALRLDGPVDVGLLQAALDLVLSRHDALRSSFSRGGGAYQMIVHAQIQSPLVELRLDADAPEDRQEEALALIRARFKSGIDPTAAPLIWSARASLAPDATLLAFLFHHTIVDGWSIGVILREMSTAYRQLAEHGRIALPPVETQMGDFALWEQRFVASDAHEASLRFWRDLHGAAPDLAPPGSAGPRHSGQIQFVIEAPELQALRPILASSRATMFMAAVAAWHRALQERLGVERRTFRIPASNRQHAEWRGLVGSLWNAIYVPLDPLPRIGGLSDLRAVRDRLVACAPHMDVPVRSLSDALQDHIRSAGSRFNIGLYNHRLGADFRLDGVDTRLMDLGAADPTGELDLRLWHDDEGMEGRLTYLADRYTPEAAQSLVDQFRSSLIAYGDV